MLRRCPVRFRRLWLAAVQRACAEFLQPPFYRKRSVGSWCVSGHTAFLFSELVPDGTPAAPFSKRLCLCLNPVLFPCIVVPVPFLILNVFRSFTLFWCLRQCRSRRAFFFFATRRWAVVFRGVDFRGPDNGSFVLLLCRPKVCGDGSPRVTILCPGAQFVHPRACGQSVWPVL